MSAMCKPVTETRWRKVTVLHRSDAMRSWEDIAWIEDIHIFAPVGARFEHDMDAYYVTDVTVDVDTRSEIIKVILTVRPV